MMHCNMRTLLVFTLLYLEAAVIAQRWERLSHLLGDGYVRTAYYGIVCLNTRLSKTQAMAERRFCLVESP